MEVNHYRYLVCLALSQNLYHWAVGWIRDDGKFEKLSVVSAAGDEEVRPSDIGLENKNKMILC